MAKPRTSTTGKGTNPGVEETRLRSKTLTTWFPFVPHAVAENRFVRVLQEFPAQSLQPLIHLPQASS